MTFDIFFWGWLIFAMILFVGEIFTAGFVLAAFGIGALAGALFALFGFEVQWQLLVFIAVSAISVTLSRRFADRVSGEQPENVGVDRVLGKRAVVLETIEPLAGLGRVRIEREEWRAESADEESIPSGTVVEIIGVEGTRVLVRPTADQQL
ncbi:MAG: NfeD family protein [Chloroflexi bacterium]|nr:NfeD family protein [Chloroflexota bacterium]